MVLDGVIQQGKCPLLGKLLKLRATPVVLCNDCRLCVAHFFFLWPDYASGVTVPNKFCLSFFAPTPLIDDASAGQKKDKKKRDILSLEANECARDDGMRRVRKFSDDLTILFLYAGIKE